MAQITKVLHRPSPNSVKALVLVSPLQLDTSNPAFTLSLSNNLQW